MRKKNFYLLLLSFLSQRELKQGLNPWYPRDKWDILDPHGISECVFASSMILR